MFNKKGGQVPEEYIELRNRVSKLEKKMNKCECDCKFKSGDEVKFIYCNYLFEGTIQGKLESGRGYCVSVCNDIFEIPEKQICHK